MTDDLITIHNDADGDLEVTEELVSAMKKNIIRNSDNMLNDLGVTISMSSLPSHDRLQKIRGYFDPPLARMSVLWLVEPQLLSPRWWWRNRIQRLVLPLRYRRLRAELKEAEAVVQTELLNAILDAGSEMAGGGDG